MEHEFLMIDVNTSKYVCKCLTPVDSLEDLKKHIVEKTKWRQRRIDDLKERLKKNYEDNKARVCLYKPEHLFGDILHECEWCRFYKEQKKMLEEQLAFVEWRE